ncbi:hypothetical protein EC991_008338 [Linnemannia zychae]|nr:hypothetical protein EC991_008338 [Linnemannia zychae]
MSIYTKPKNSDLQLSLYLSQSLSYLSDHAAMTLFSVRKLNVGSSQKVFNPDGAPIADTVQLTMRSSSIGSNSVDLQLFYDPYDWSFPPDIVLHGLYMKPSLTDLGLDDTWDHEDPANLSKVLKKLSYMMQVVFAVPFYIDFQDQGANQQVKLVAKIQFVISSLVPNDVAAVKSHIEPLSAFAYPDLLRGTPDIGKHEPVTDYIGRVSNKISEHFGRIQRKRNMKKEMIKTLLETFRPVKPREGTATAIATFYLTDSFPDEYPKVTLSAPLLPSSSYLPTPEPEVIPIKLYSPRWGCDRIVNEIWEQLWEEIPRYYGKALHLASAPSSHP